MWLDVCLKVCVEDDPFLVRVDGADECVNGMGSVVFVVLRDEEKSSEALKRLSSR